MNDRLQLLAKELASVFHDPDAAKLLAVSSGFPRANLPAFATPLLFWNEVVEAVRSGKTAGGVDAIVAAAVEQYPANPVFAGHGSTPSNDRPEARPPSTPAPAPPVDVVLLTALHEEYLAVLSVEDDAIDPQWIERPDGPNGRLVARRRFRGARGHAFTVLATWADGMAGNAAAAIAGMLVSMFKPRCLAMTGIAAGPRGKVELGDVVFGRVLFTHDTGKVKATDAGSDRTVTFKGDLNPYRMDHRWKQRVEAFSAEHNRWLVRTPPKWARDKPLTLERQGQWMLARLLERTSPATHSEQTTHCPDWKATIERLRSKRLLKKTELALTKKGKKEARVYADLHPGGLEPPPPVSVRLGDIASGSAVIEDADIFARIEASMRKTIGLEMEAAAIAAVADLGGVPWLVAKAVCDFGDPDKDNHFHDFAARASAECLLALLRRHSDLLGPLTQRPGQTSFDVSTAGWDAGDGQTTATRHDPKVPGSLNAVDEPKRTPTAQRPVSIEAAVQETSISTATAIHKAPREASTPECSLAPNISEEEYSTYRALVRARYGVNRFLGFDSPIECEMAWEKLYVDLMMDKAHGHTREVRGLAPEQITEGKTVSLDKAFRYASDNGRRGLVMLGDPGTGKTTQLQQVLLRVLDETRGPTSLGLPEGTVAVFVALQDFPKAVEQLGGEPEFSAIVARAAAIRHGGISEEVIRRLLGSRRVLLLLDGLDEIPDPEQRARVSMMIGTAHEDGLPEHRMLVSSRYAGYADAKTVHLGNAFLELKLRPLNGEQVELLVHNWYRAVECHGVQEDQQVAREEEARDRAEALIRKIQAPALASESRLQEMAQTPLLLTALCLIDRERRRRGEEGLPQDRGAIYEECEEILLGHWQRTTKRRFPSLTGDDARRVLKPVAYWLHDQQQRRHATVAELHGAVAEGLGAIGKATEDAAEFVRSFSSESGLLTPWGPKLYGFVHLGFQEHLAALHIRESWTRDEVKRVRTLAGHFGESWWREVIRLALSGAEASVVAGFFEAVVQEPEFPVWALSRLMSLCVRGREARNVQPLVELLRAPVGSVSEEHQIAVLRLLVQERPEVLDGEDARLRVHAVEGVQRRWRTRTRWDEVGRTKFDPKTGIEFVWIPGGWFMMGSAKDDSWAREDERPQREVELSGFWLGKTVVTNEHYRAYVKANPGAPVPRQGCSGWSTGGKHPIVGVSWEQAQAYCDWAGYYLPTEAQWEYSCRAGTTTRYYSGDSESDLDPVAWHGGNSGSDLHAVGELGPNKFGLYDMHGNIDEWCREVWIQEHDKTKHRSGDGLHKNVEGGVYHVLRGGPFLMGPARGFRSASRAKTRATGLGAVGFRPVIEPSTQPSDAPF